MTINNLPIYQANLPKWGGVVATLASLLAISQPAQALTLFGNYSSTNDAGFTLLTSTNSAVKAVGFDLPVGTAYTFDSVRLRLRNYNTTTGDVARVRIFADPAGTTTSTAPNFATPQALLFSTLPSSSDLAGNFDFTPTTTFTFLANTRYWLVVDATAGSFDWTSDIFNSGITPSGIAGFTGNSYRTSSNGGSSYSTSTLFNSFQINATQVAAVPFEFNPALGLVAVGGFWLVQKRLKNKSNNA
jgi:hypothetical protein